VKKDLVQAYLLVIVIALSVYFGIYSDIKGMNNIGNTILWIIGVLLFLTIFMESKKGNKKPNFGKHRYVIRTIAFSSVIAMIYGGSIVLGVIYGVAILNQIMKKQKEKKCQEN